VAATRLQNENYAAEYNPAFSAAIKHSLRLWIS